jgi:hypothetical protein
MFKPDFKTGSAVETALVDSLVQRAVAFYQVAAWLIKNKKEGVN